jgi:hypothetical protein
MGLFEEITKVPCRILRSLQRKRPVIPFSRMHGAVFEALRHKLKTFGLRFLW